MNTANAHHIHQRSCLLGLPRMLTMRALIITGAFTQKLRPYGWGRAGGSGGTGPGSMAQPGLSGVPSALAGMPFPPPVNSML